MYVIVEWSNEWVWVVILLNGIFPSLGGAESYIVVLIFF